MHVRAHLAQLCLCEAVFFPKMPGYYKTTEITFENLLARMKGDRAAAWAAAQNLHARWDPRAQLTYYAWTEWVEEEQQENQQQQQQQPQ